MNQSLSALAKLLSNNQGRTPVDPRVNSYTALATVSTVNGVSQNADGTVNITFDQLTTVSATSLGLFVPVAGQLVLCTVYGTQIFVIAPYFDPQGGTIASEKPAGSISLLNTLGSVAPSGVFDGTAGVQTQYLYGNMMSDESGGFLTVPETGVYSVKAAWAGFGDIGGTPTFTECEVYLNDVPIVLAPVGAVSGSTAGAVATLDVDCNPGDSFSWGWRFVGGTSLTIVGSPIATYLHVHLVTRHS